MRLFGKPVIFVALAVVLLGAAAGDAIAAPAEVHRFRLNQWSGLNDELSYATLTAQGGATQAANTGRSANGSTAYGGGTGATFACVEDTAVSPDDTAGCSQGYKFDTGQGLSLATSKIAGGGAYSIVMDFMFTATSGLFKVLDFKGLCGDSVSNTDVNATCNSGLYVANGASTRRLTFTPSAGGAANGTNMTIAGTRMARVVVTRGEGETASNRVRIWNDEVLAPALDFSDTLGDTIFSPSTVLNFFMDDETGLGASQGAGYVDTIRVFNYALSSTEVAALTEVEDIYVDPYTDPVPEPGSLLLIGTGLAVIGARLRKRAAR